MNSMNLRVKLLITATIQERKMLEAIRYVDLVIPENNWEQKANDVTEYHIDTVIYGLRLGRFEINLIILKITARLFSLKEPPVCPLL